MSAQPTSLLWHPALSKIKKRVKSVEYNFIGCWAYAECWDGTAYWVQVESGVVVPSSRNDFPDVKKKAGGKRGKGRVVVMAENGWKQEAIQLRKNHSEDRAAISAFVDLFEAQIEKVDSPLLCLALHHIAMSFHVCAGEKTIRKMHKADLDALPEAIYPADRIVNLEKVENCGPR